MTAAEGGAGPESFGIFATDTSPNRSEDTFAPGWSIEPDGLQASRRASTSAGVGSVMSRGKVRYKPGFGILYIPSRIFPIPPFVAAVCETSARAFIGRTAAAYTLARAQWSREVTENVEAYADAILVAAEAQSPQSSSCFFRALTTLGGSLDGASVLERMGLRSWTWGDSSDVGDIGVHYIKAVTVDAPTLRSNADSYARPNTSAGMKRIALAIEDGTEPALEEELARLGVRTRDVNSVVHSGVATVSLRSREKGARDEVSGILKHDDGRGRLFGAMDLEQRPARTTYYIFVELDELYTGWDLARLPSLASSRFRTAFSESVGMSAAHGQSASNIAPPAISGDEDAPLSPSTEVVSRDAALGAASAIAFKLPRLAHPAVQFAVVLPPPNAVETRDDALAAKAARMMRAAMRWVDADVHVNGESDSSGPELVIVRATDIKTNRSGVVDDSDGRVFATAVADVSGRCSMPTSTSSSSLAKGATSWSQRTSFRLASSGASASTCTKPSPSESSSTCSCRARSSSTSAKPRSDSLPPRLLSATATSRTSPAAKSSRTTLR